MEGKIPQKQNGYPKKEENPMAKRIAPLTDAKIRTVKITEKPQKLFDGGGLFLLVTPSGGKLWRLKYRFDEKEKGSSAESVGSLWFRQVAKCMK